MAGPTQYVLDLGWEAVRQHPCKQINAVLRSKGIDFVKWDMNRDFTHAAGADGRMGVRAHLLGLYVLLAQLSVAFRQLEIETCASGGGCADLGMSAHARRVWMSDCNHPLERKSVHTAFLHFLPPETMGAHVGAERSHTAGRAADMALRTLSAAFGYLGLEADLTALPPADAQHLQQAIAAYQEARARLADAEVGAATRRCPDCCKCPE